MSTISLEGQLFVDLKIDDLDIQTGLPNFLEELSIIENVAGVPVMTMVINDGEGYISEEIPLTDGNKFSIVIASDLKDLKENKSFDFRLFNWKGVQHQRGLKYKLNALFDNNPFVSQVIQKVYTGSSDYVLKQLAKDCDLDFVGEDSCVDSQAWINFSDTLSTFSRKISQHSFIQNGCMAVAVCANGDLIYKDIIKAINGEPDAYFDSATSDSEKGIMLMQEYSPSSSAGFMNSWLNYGYVSVEDFLSGESEVYDAVTLTSTSGGSAAVNQDVSDEVQSVRRDYIMQDCGNTHSRYWKTFHNNLRVLGLFSQKIVFLVDQVTNLSLLDVVHLNIPNGNTNKPTSFSGKYIVGAKKTLVKGTKYAELFEVYRNTVPIEGNVSLSNSAPSGGSPKTNKKGVKSAPPEVIVVTEMQTIKK